ncbi:MAG TPA: hypothetical protein VEK08_26980 [Planctomycetota bacterium]|nr:hypothetical protein [Planctomycetota bacterium]
MSDVNAVEMTTLKLSKQAVIGAWNAMLKTRPKGRGEARAHARITAQLKEKCMDPVEGAEDSFNFKKDGGVIVLDDERFDYLNESVTNLLKGQQIEGNLGQAFGELVEALDSVPEPK